MKNLLFESAQQYEDLEHDCKDFLELRTRPKGQGCSYVYQCMYCGEQRGNDIAKSKIKYMPPPFDFELTKLFNEKREEILGSQCKSTLNEKLNKLARELDVISSKYREEEFFELINLYLRKKREAKTQKYESSYHNEQAISEWFEKVFCKWFHIDKEIEGCGYVNGQKKRIRLDYIIQAKQELLDAGFTDKPIGVEVKFFDPRTDCGFRGKTSRGVFQALSYCYSSASWIFGEKSTPQTLCAVLLLSNLSFRRDRDYIFNSYDNHYKTDWETYMNLANHGNVGELLVYKYSHNNLNWSIQFSGVNFCRNYEGKITLHKNHDNLINKVRIGNTN